jgi:AraC-like DNA-binding protein
VSYSRINVKAELGGDSCHFAPQYYGLNANEGGMRTTSAAALGRVAQIYPFVDFFEDIGVPIQEKLSRYPLPPALRENGDMLVSTPAMFAFVADMAKAQGVENIGWNLPNLDKMDLRLRTKLRGSRTLLNTITRVCRYTRLDSSRVTAWLQKQGADYYFCHRGSLPIDSNGAEITTMMRAVVILSIIRAHLGRDWYPAEMGFEMTGPISPLIQESMGNTRFYSAPTYGWIHLPQSTLCRPLLYPLGKDAARSITDSYSEPRRDLTGSIKQLIMPYLQDGAPTLQFAASLVNRSPRSLQRDLSNAGSSYRDLVLEVRFERACQLLRLSDIKVQDIAFELGYTEPAHFTRFFENVAGVSPRKYRHLHTKTQTP